MVLSRIWYHSTVLITLLALFAGHVGVFGSHRLVASSNIRIQIRRDTSVGLPFNDAHSAGVSSIVSGTGTPGTTITLALLHASDPAVVRSVTADADGAFMVSMDRLIADGDSLQVSDGTTTKIVPVPALSFSIDPIFKVIRGTGPANITTTASGAPHSLTIAFDRLPPHQVTTASDGTFMAAFSDSPFQPGALGALRYTTPDGDVVNKPVWVAEPFARDVPGDGWADVVLGQPGFQQTTFNEVSGTHLFNPAGVYVDRSKQPNRVYVYDAGNSRILGLRALGTTSAGQPCTSFGDYASSCTIQSDRPADLVLGQPSATTSTCNGDSNFQHYPDVALASATTLCGTREEQLSLSEGGSGVTMASDQQGNLYVPDFFNNRILRYDDPFATDSIADYVWGQADFAGVSCNRGASVYQPSANSLCLGPPPYYGDLMAGVALDAANNLWVTDTQNNRVLRFPFDQARGAPAAIADLVLGQPSFTIATPGSGMNQMSRPASVRASAGGVIYVADSLNDRVLAFSPPFTSGMGATRIVGSGLVQPRGLEIDPNGALWVGDSGNHRYVRFVGEVQQEIVPAVDQRAWGGMGIDRDGNLLSAGWDLQEVLHFTRSATTQAYVQDAIVYKSIGDWAFNQTGPRGLNGGLGLEVTDDQLIYGDGSRLLFWNNPQGLSTDQPADGVIGALDFQTRAQWGPWFGRMRTDGKGNLWVLHGDLDNTWLEGYRLPLTSGATAAYTLTSPLPVQGGGSFDWKWTLLLGGVAIQPACDCVWLSDEESHRVFRVRNSTTQPVVDIILGQTSLTGTQCNQGRGLSSPTADSLCHPGALAFDPNGNLFVADHNLEFDGNWRLLEFDATTLPDAPPQAVFGIAASHVFGRGGSFTAPSCLTAELDPLCGPWEPTFDSQGHMVVGMNGVIGSRFPLIYQDPLVNPLPVGVLGDYQSMPTSARFDRHDNLYLIDHNRSRILIYHGGVAPPRRKAYYLSIVSR